LCLHLITFGYCFLFTQFKRCCGFAFEIVCFERVAKIEFACLGLGAAKMYFKELVGTAKYEVKNEINFAINLEKAGPSH
jgi:hypothetical protein